MVGQWAVYSADELVAKLVDGKVVHLAALKADELAEKMVALTVD